MPIYATPAQYATFANLVQGQLPTNIDAHIRLASSAVRRATRGARYGTNPQTDLPTSPKYLRAFADATCAQVAAQIQHKIDPVGGSAAMKPQLASKGLGSANWSYVTDSNKQLLMSKMADGEILHPIARDILAEAGLLTTRVSDYPGGNFPTLRYQPGGHPLGEFTIGE